MIEFMSVGHMIVWILFVLFVSMKQLLRSSTMTGVAVLMMIYVSSRFEMISKIEKFGHKLAI